MIFMVIWMSLLLLTLTCSSRTAMIFHHIWCPHHPHHLPLWSPRRHLYAGWDGGHFPSKLFTSIHHSSWLFIVQIMVLTSTHLGLPAWTPTVPLIASFQFGNILAQKMVAGCRHQPTAKLPVRRKENWFYSVHRMFHQQWHKFHQSTTYLGPHAPHCEAIQYAYWTCEGFIRMGSHRFFGEQLWLWFLACSYMFLHSWLANSMHHCFTIL